MLVAAGVAWDDLLRLARHHRVGPIIWQTLEQLGISALPVKVRKELHTISQANALRSTQTAFEIARVTAKLREHGYKSTVLKGLPLSQTIFGRPNTRQSGDIDLLTSTHLIDRQISLLESLGYKRQSLTARVTPKRIASFSRHWKGITFFQEELRLELDLHWRLFNNEHHPCNRMLTDAEIAEIKVLSTTMQAFSPADQLIYVAAHGAMDGWTYLKSLADLAGLLKVLEQQQLDQALVRARGLGLDKQVSAAIHIASAWMELDISSAQLCGDTEKICQRLSKDVLAALHANDLLTTREQKSAAALWRHERLLIPGPRALWSAVKRYVWRPRTWSVVDLPDRFFALYALIGCLLLPRLSIRSKSR